MPTREGFPYTFAKLAEVIERFTEVVGLVRFAMYVFDYGAPTGFRLAVSHPERITAIISQNGNAYEEGLSDGWNPIRAYWQDASQANRNALRSFLTPETTLWQYTHGVADVTRVSPDGYSLDNLYLSRPGAHEIQLDLFGDYKSNVALYPAFQAYFRTHKPPFLAVWGENDPFFLPPGAKAFKRDIPNAEIRFFDTGHFALETHCDEIAAAIREFFDRSKAG
jgi:pimeloyl-ACP methyl ester carboxylesterase